MGKNLVIVESPAKAQAINKYLGSQFEVMASYGHVRDLIPKEGAVDPEHDFAMHYAEIERNSKQIERIVSKAKKADALYLATDLDREGEAISWHVHEILRERGVLADLDVHRIVFHEITPRAIQEAVEHPRGISMDLVNAQQARRALDYLVGFNLSPLLWKKLRRGLSAGRVQTPALRMIVEREEEIERFEPQEYWTLEADLRKGEHPFEAKLVRFHGEKVEQFSFVNEQQAETARSELERAASGKLSVAEVQRKERKRRPAPPFITSTLQQEASRKLGFSAQRTMRTAQGLYEGIDIGGSVEGLITYMRTDSVHLANDALAEIRETVANQFGAEQLPEKPNTYKTQSKNAQEAHEAIRPTTSARTPKSVKPYLSGDQAKLYELIWKRTVASQMRHALLNTVSVEFDCGEGNRLRATGTTVAYPGFLSVYEEGKDNQKEAKESKLPKLAEGDVVDVDAIRGEQHFTEPPPRYTEASLVKALEEHGIGRPSTYASIISTLLSRNYVELDRKRFMPTDIGRVVSKFLSNYFTRYVDYDFTARLEDELDEISRGEKDWVPLLREFWDPFRRQVKETETSVTRAEAAMQRELGTDPETGKPVAVRMGRYGPYVQLGTPEDEERPRFAGLRPGQKMETVTLEEALKLFQLPRDLGETEEGEPITVNIGRFGPYVRFGNKFASLREDDPFTIERERALEVIREKKRADANRIIRTFDDGIQVLNGRFGPYVTDGNKNAKVPKDQEPAELDHAACLELLANAPERRGRRGAKKAAKKTAAAAAKKSSAKKTGKKKAAAKKTGKKKATKKKAGKKKAAAKKTAKKAAAQRRKKAATSGERTAEKQVPAEDVPEVGTRAKTAKGGQ